MTCMGPYLTEVSWVRVERAPWVTHCFAFLVAAPGPLWGSGCPEAPRAFALLESSTWDAVLDFFPSSPKGRALLLLQFDCDLSPFRGDFWGGVRKPFQKFIQLGPFLLRACCAPPSRVREGSRVTEVTAYAPPWGSGADSGEMITWRYQVGISYDIRGRKGLGRERAGGWQRRGSAVRERPSGEIQRRKVGERAHGHVGTGLQRGDGWGVDGCLVPGPGAAGHVCAKGRRQRWVLLSLWPLAAEPFFIKLLLWAPLKTPQWALVYSSPESYREKQPREDETLVQDRAARQGDAGPMQPRPPMPGPVLFRDTCGPAGSPGTYPEHGRQMLMFIRKGKSGSWGGPLVPAVGAPCFSPAGHSAGPSPRLPCGLACPAQCPPVLSQPLACLWGMSPFPLGSLWAGCQLRCPALALPRGVPHGPADVGPLENESQAVFLQGLSTVC